MFAQQQYYQPTTNCFSIPDEGTASLSWQTDFQSASQVSRALSRLGKSFDVLQLSPGSLHGHFAVAHLSGLSIFSIYTNQRLLLNGERGKDCTSFCLEASGHHRDHRVHAESISAYSLHGFKPDLLESHFQLTAGSNTIFAITSSKRFGTFLERCGLSEVRETLHNSNSLALSPLLHNQIKHQLCWYINNPLTAPEQRSMHAGHIYTMMMQIFSTPNQKDFQSFEITPRQKLVHEFVSWGFQNTKRPITLDEVSNLMFSSRRTLIQGCKENFNKGPMELLRDIRLEQVNVMLRSEKARASLKLNTVGAIAAHFGFTSRGHFSAAYQKYFEETPKQTLTKTKT